MVWESPFFYLALGLGAVTLALGYATWVSSRRRRMTPGEKAVTRENWGKEEVK